jgi:branched-chain amino acid transport system permease protein
MVTQLLLNGVIAASSYALVGLGFWLVYATSRFFNFSHGAVIAFGAYAALALTRHAHCPVALAVAGSILLSGGVGVLIDRCIYRPIRVRRGPPLVLLLASLGLYVVLQNAISLVFGDSIQSIAVGPVTTGHLLFTARVTSVQVITIALSAVSFGLLVVLMHCTRWGICARAVAGNPELAQTTGVDPHRVIAWAFALGSALGGLAGCMAGLDVGMVPTMGSGALLMGIVAVVVGGTRRVAGVAVGALLLGLVRQLSVLGMGSEWQDAIAFVVLAAFLLVRPEGFVGPQGA